MSDEMVTLEIEVPRAAADAYFAMNGPSRQWTDRPMLGGVALVHAVLKAIEAPPEPLPSEPDRERSIVVDCEGDMWRFDTSTDRWTFKRPGMSYASMTWSALRTFAPLTVYTKEA